MMAAPSASLYKAAVLQGASAAWVAGLLGGVAGVVGLLSGGGSRHAGAVGAAFFPALVVLVPLVVVAVTIGPLLHHGRAIYAGPRRREAARLVTVGLIVAALVGSLGGSLLFVVAATYLPVILSLYRLNAVVVGVELRTSIGTGLPALVVSVTMLTIIAEVVYLRRRFGRTDELR